MPMISGTNILWLLCEGTAAGTFSTERIAQITDVENHKLSLMVDTGLLKQTEDKTALKVYFAEQRSSNIITVLLPTETMETGSRWINIDNGRIMNDTKQLRDYSMS